MDGGTGSELRGKQSGFCLSVLSDNTAARFDRSASLLVDNGQTVTGTAPGVLTQLNTRPILYLGNNLLLSQLSHSHTFRVQQTYIFSGTKT